MKRYITYALAAFLLLALAACAPKEEAPSSDADQDVPLEKIVFTEPVRAYHWAPAYLAQSLGYFAEEGLDAEFLTVTGADASAPVFAGEAQFGLRGVEMALMSAEAGLGCKILYSTTGRYPYQLISAGPSYDSIASLSGGVIGGGQGPASGPQAFVNAIMQQEALDATLINMQSAGYLAAIARGEIQAAVATNPWAMKNLLDVGGKILVDGSNEADMQKLIDSKTYELFMIFASDAYIESHPETVEKAVRAIARAGAWMQSASPEDIAKQLEPLFVGRYEELLYCATFDKTAKVSSATGYHSESGYAAALALTQLSGGIKTQEIPASEVYDESFLDAAQEALGQ